MDQNLQRLARELRAETCPARVLARVDSRLARSQSPSRSVPVGATLTACLAVLAALFAMWTWPHRVVQGPSRSAARTRADQIQVANQTQAALGYIGSVLVDAGSRTEQVISKQAVPPLQSGLEAAARKLKYKP